MNNIDIYEKLLNYIYNDYEAFTTLLSADNTLGLNVTIEEIINFLEFGGNDNFKSPLIGTIIITEGDILSVLKIILELRNYTGEYILYINLDNAGTITYLCDRANKIYKEFGIDVAIKLDYSINYNAYLNSIVNVVGNKSFINEALVDFPSCNQIVV